MVIDDFLNNYEKVMNDVYALNNFPASKVNWEPARVGTKKNPEQLDVDFRDTDCLVLNTKFLINSDPVLKTMGNLAYSLSSNIKRGIEMYTKEYPQGGYMNPPEKINTLLRYRSGQKFHFHDDWGPLNNRLISYLIYLNDDYSGGEIDFKNIGIKFKPKANSMVIFPSNFLFSHEALPVESGEKFAVVNWITYT